MFEENKDDFSPPEEDLSGEETVTAGLVLHSDPLHLHQTVTHLLPALLRLTVGRHLGWALRAQGCDVIVTTDSTFPFSCQEESCSNPYAALSSAMSGHLEIVGHGLEASDEVLREEHEVFDVVDVGEEDFDVRLELGFGGGQLLEEGKG